MGNGSTAPVEEDRPTANHLAGGRTVLLSVGLGRPWPESDPAHWLQVNNIHLEPETR